MKALLKILGAIALALIFFGALRGQSSFSIPVASPAGTAVPGARVTLTCLSGGCAVGRTYLATTDSNGQAQFSNVATGQYMVAVSGSGISSYSYAYNVPNPYPCGMRNVICVDDVSYPWTDIGASINAGFAACASSVSPTTFCDVEVPSNPNNYTFATTIRFPYPSVNGPIKARLTFAPGVYAQYTGTGDAILIDCSKGGVANPSFQIRGDGAWLYGTGKVGNGIHEKGCGSGFVSGLGITNFENGILSDGSNSVTHNVLNVSANHVGVRHYSNTFSGVLHGSNNNSFFGGNIQANDTWGVMDDATNQPTTTGNFHNTYYGTTIEGNGSATSAVKISTCALNAGVVTLTTSPNIYGLAGGVIRIVGSATGNGSFKILSSNGTNQVTYASSKNCTAGNGTAQLEVSNVFLEGGDSYLFDGVWFEQGNATVPAEVVVGTTNQVSTDQGFKSDTLGDPNVTSFIDNVNGQGTHLENIRVPLAITNLVNNSPASTGLAILEPSGNFTYVCTGTCTSSTISFVKLPGSGFGVGQLPAMGATNQDISVRALYLNQTGTCYLSSNGSVTNLGTAGACGALTLPVTTVSGLPSASSNPGAIARVSDSTRVITEGQTCAGNSTNSALAFSNGSVWKCF